MLIPCTLEKIHLQVQLDFMLLLHISFLII